MFQNRSKILVKRRERDLHDVFQRLSILRRLRHELKTLQAAIEESRDGAEVLSFLELAIFPSRAFAPAPNLLPRRHYPPRPCPRPPDTPPLPPPSHSLKTPRPPPGRRAILRRRPKTPAATPSSPAPASPTPQT